MGKKGTIVFWIVFPLVVCLIACIFVFYFDLANGPLACFIIALIALAVAAAFRVLLRNKKFVIRMIPTISLGLVAIITMATAKPGVQEKSVAYYNNPTKTEVLHLLNGDVQGLLSEDKKV